MLIAHEVIDAITEHARFKECLEELATHPLSEMGVPSVANTWINRKAETMSEFGQEEGETCWRNGCEGKIAVHPVENCSCHIHPPCGSCTEHREHCPECDWHAKDDEQVSYRHLGGGISEMLTGPQPRPLDPRKIDYRITSHTNASQKCEGVYPEGATMADVLAKVKGTFGGRFEYFANGKFRYIAYTD